MLEYMVSWIERDGALVVASFRTHDEALTYANANDTHNPKVSTWCPSLYDES